ncbi:hypothetical protein FDF74_04125 [Clostridium niameyense]|uniref:Transcobalamin-like C-terminal domain-containing protein n=1 Tax=Clostridium niameyense TaxID=1622073 RepID=A0A6M0R9Q7_9CLOT|nr:DUF4430 domain-containing protein [Clostridium niameyense]NEZ46400.1 hypothetical protein [Clostridium niameyense]
MKIKKRILSSIICGLFLTLNIFNSCSVFAKDQKDYSVEVIVNGVKDVITEDKSDKDNAYEALQEVLAKHNIKYKAEDSEYGKYIKSIENIEPGSIKKYSGWSYVVNRSNKYIEPMCSIDKFKLENKDRLIVYFGEWNTTLLPNEIKYSTLEEKKPLTITLNNVKKDWNTGKDNITLVKDINVKIDGYTVNLEGNKIHIKDGLKQGDHTLTLSDFSIDGEKLPKVVGDTIHFNINKSEKNKENTEHKDTSSKDDKDINTDNDENKDKVENNINIDKQFSATVDYVKNLPINTWTALDFKALGIDFSKEYVKDYEKALKVKPISKWSNTEVEKAILGIMAAGYNPYNFANCNLIENLYNRDINSFLVNDAAFALIVYNYGDINGNYKITREVLKDYITKSKVQLKISDKEYYGWNFYSGAKDIDPDMTAMVIGALEPFYDKDIKVKNALDKAVKTLNYMETEDGLIKGSYGVSSESTACAIMALTSLGIDPSKGDFQKTKGNLLSGLLSLKLEDGTLKHTLEDKRGNNFSTEQALRAYISLKNFNETGKYNYYANKVKADKLPIYDYKVKQNYNKDSNKIIKHKDNTQNGNIPMNSYNKPLSSNKQGFKNNDFYSSKKALKIIENKAKNHAFGKNEMEEPLLKDDDNKVNKSNEEMSINNNLNNMESKTYVKNNKETKETKENIFLFGKSKITNTIIVGVICVSLISLYFIWKKK